MVSFRMNSIARGRVSQSDWDDRDYLHVDEEGERSLAGADRVWFVRPTQLFGGSAHGATGAEEALVWHQKQSLKNDTGHVDLIWELQWRTAGITRYTWFEASLAECMRRLQDQRSETLRSCSTCQGGCGVHGIGPIHHWTVFARFSRQWKDRRTLSTSSKSGRAGAESADDETRPSFLGWCAVQDTGRVLQVFDWNDGTMYSVSFVAKGEWLGLNQIHRRSVSSLYGSMHRSSPADQASLTPSTTLRESALMTSPSSSWLAPVSMMMPAASNACATIWALHVLPLGVLVALIDGRKLLLRHPMEDPYELEELQSQEQVVFTDARFPVLITQQCHSGSGASLSEFHTIRVYLVQETSSHEKASALETGPIRLALVWEQGLANPKDTFRGACLSHPWSTDPYPLLCLLIGRTLRGLALFRPENDSTRLATADMVFLQHHVEAMVAIEALRPGLLDLLVLEASPNTATSPDIRLRLQFGSVIVGQLLQSKAPVAAAGLSNPVGSRFTITLVDGTQYRLCLGRMIRETLPWMHQLLRACRKTLPSAVALTLYVAFMKELLVSLDTFGRERAFNETSLNVLAFWRALQCCWPASMAGTRNTASAHSSMTQETDARSERYLAGDSPTELDAGSDHAILKSQTEPNWEPALITCRRRLPCWLWDQNKNESCTSTAHEAVRSETHATDASERGQLSLSPLHLTNSSRNGRCDASTRAHRDPFEGMTEHSRIGCRPASDKLSAEVIEAEPSGVFPEDGSTKPVGQLVVDKITTEPNGKPQRHHWAPECETNPTERTVKPIWEFVLAVENPEKSWALPVNALLETLHAVYEAYKLDQVCWPYLIPMAGLLKAIAAAAGATAFWEYYQRDVPEEAPQSLWRRSSVEATKEMSRTTMIRGRSSPPSIFRWLQHRLRLLLLLLLPPPPGIVPETTTSPTMSVHAIRSSQQRQDDHPLVGSAHALAEDWSAKDASNPLARMAGLIRLFERLEQWLQEQENQERAHGLQAPTSALRERPDLALHREQTPGQASRIGAAFHRLHDSVVDLELDKSVFDVPDHNLQSEWTSLADQLVQWMLDAGLDASVLARLPAAVALPLQQVLGQARRQPHAHWQASAYALIGRDDLAPTLPDTKWLQPAGRLPALPEPELAMLRIQGGLPTAMHTWSTLEMHPETWTANLWLTRTPYDPTEKTGALSGSGHLGRRPMRGQRATGAAHSDPTEQNDDEVQVDDDPNEHQGYRDGTDDRGQVDQDPKEDADDIDPNQLDGCELPDLVPWLRFRSDRRLWEVQRLLRSSVPMVLDAASERALEEQDPTQTMTRQQAVLFAGAQRTLAAPVGRGAFTAWTGRPGNAAHTVVVPPLVLAGRVAGHPLPIQLDASALTPSYFEWSEFHNAVAAGLRLRPARTNEDLYASSKQRLFCHPVQPDDPTRPGHEAHIGAGLSSTTITRAWIRQQRPSRPSATHAGLVLALGLNGHLRRLQVTDWYAYLLPRHELTSIALLLGLAASYRGTAQPLVARLIGLHIRAFNPTGFAQPDWDVSPAVQSAAVVGMGLVFMSTNRKAILEGLVAELVQGAAASSTSAPSAGTSNATATVGNIRTSTSRDREAHALAAGLALGLVGMPRDTLDRDEMKPHRAERYGSSTWVLAPAAGRYVDDLLTLVTRTGRGDHGEARDASTLVPGLGTCAEEAGVASRWNDPFDASVDTMMLSAPELALGRHLYEPSLQQQRAHGVGEPAPDARPSVLLEPERARGDVAAVGALYALMLWYLQSNMEQMARRLGLPPGGRTALWHIRPELILLRSMAAALIRWDAMRPDWTWMLSQLPPVLANQWQEDRTREQEAAANIQTGPESNQRDRVRGRVWRWRWQVALQNDPIDVAEQVPMDERTRSWLSRPPGSCSSTASSSTLRSQQPSAATRTALVRLYTLLAMTGQALALGLKMTGTADAQAKQLLEELLQLVDTRYAANRQCSAAPWLIACIDNLAVALALVCAGHGTLSVLRRLRRLCLRRCRRLHESRYAYGNHLALHLALGLLFLGGGTRTLGSGRMQTAMLLMTLYPRYPAAPSDNQYHLQALRHCYVLAMEARCLETRDIDTNTPCPVPIEITMVPSEQSSSSSASTETSPLRCLRWTPCLLPAWSTWTTLRVCSPRYWPVTISAADLRNTRPAETDDLHYVVYVKRHAGHLSYLRDRRGVKGLASRSLPLRSSKRQPSADWMQLFATDPLVMALLRYGLRFSAHGEHDQPEETNSYPALVQGREREHSPRSSLAERSPDESMVETRTAGIERDEVAASRTEASYWRSCLDRCLEADRMDLLPHLLQLYDEAHRGGMRFHRHTLWIMNQVLLQHWAYAACSADMAAVRCLSPERCLNRWCWFSIVALGEQLERALGLESNVSPTWRPSRGDLLQCWLQDEEMCWRSLSRMETYRLAALLQLIQSPLRSTLPRGMIETLQHLHPRKEASLSGAVVTSWSALLEAQAHPMHSKRTSDDWLNLVEEWFPALAATAALPE